MEAVRIWEEDVVIPTYEVGEPDKNPMFLEKRVYQGSSGKLYPYPTTEKISHEKKDKVWHAVYLENEYLKIMVLRSWADGFRELMTRRMIMILCIIIM